MRVGRTNQVTSVKFQDLEYGDPFHKTQSMSIRVKVFHADYNITNIPSGSGLSLSIEDGQLWMITLDQQVFPVKGKFVEE